MLHPSTLQVTVASLLSAALVAADAARETRASAPTGAATSQGGAAAAAQAQAAQLKAENEDVVRAFQYAVVKRGLVEKLLAAAAASPAASPARLTLGQVRRRGIRRGRCPLSLLTLFRRPLHRPSRVRASQFLPRC